MRPLPSLDLSFPVYQKKGEHSAHSINILLSGGSVLSVLVTSQGSECSFFPGPTFIVPSTAYVQGPPLDGANLGSRRDHSGPKTTKGDSLSSSSFLYSHQAKVLRVSGLSQGLEAQCRTGLSGDGRWSWGRPLAEGCLKDWIKIPGSQ